MMAVESYMKWNPHFAPSAFDKQRALLGKRSQNDNISREMIDICWEIIDKCPQMIDNFREMNDNRREMIVILPTE